MHVHSHGRETDPSKHVYLPLNERADQLAAKGARGEPCFVLRRCVYFVGDDEPETTVKRCRWCDRIFLSARAARRHEACCSLQHGDPRVLQCRHCGKGFGFRYGRARRWAHERHFRGSLDANLTCGNCSVVFGSSLARRMHEKVVMFSIDVSMHSRCYSSLARQYLLGMWWRTNAMRIDVAAVEGVRQTSSALAACDVFPLLSRGLREYSCQFCCQLCDRIFRTGANRRAHEPDCCARVQG